MGSDAKSLFRIPKIKDDTIRIVCVLLDILFSGTGTIVGGILDGADVMVIVCGVLQLVCASIGVGFLWSWVWAYFIAVQKQVC